MEGVRSCFADVKVQAQEGKKRNQRILSMHATYGYECVALNRDVKLTKKFQVKPAQDVTDMVDSIPCVRGRQMKLLTRLTVATEDTSLLHTLSSPAVETYDLLAVRPKTEKVFQQACGILNIDLISVDLTERLPFYLKHPQVSQAIERGIFFEICYSPAIRDSTARRNTLSNAMELVKVSKGKNIIVSSEAEKEFDVRGTADIINLCHLFDMNDAQCKAAITTNCRTLLMHAEMRRHTTKGVVSSRALPDLASEASQVKNGDDDTRERSGGKRTRNGDEQSGSASVSGGKKKRKRSVISLS